MSRVLFFRLFSRSGKNSPRNHTKRHKQKHFASRIRGSCYVKSGTSLENGTPPCTAGCFLLASFMRALAALSLTLFVPPPLAKDNFFVVGDIKFSASSHLQFDRIKATLTVYEG